jgi:hypothetical protein
MNESDSESSSSSDEENVISPLRGQRFKDASVGLKWAIVADYNLARNGVEGQLRNGARAAMVQKFGVSSRLINKIMKSWNEQTAEGSIPDLGVKRKGICGVGNDLLTEDLVDCIFELADQLKGAFTYREFTHKFNIEYSCEPPIHYRTMHRWFKRLGVEEKTLYIKPKLRPEHYKERLKFVLNNRLEREINMATHAYNLIDMRRHLHADEKWFYMVRTVKTVRS